MRTLQTTTVIKAVLAETARIAAAVLVAVAVLAAGAVLWLAPGPSDAPAVVTAIDPLSPQDGGPDAAPEPLADPAAGRGPTPLDRLEAETPASATETGAEPVPAVVAATPATPPPVAPPQPTVAPGVPPGALPAPPFPDFAPPARRTPSRRPAVQPAAAPPPRDLVLRALNQG